MDGLVIDASVLIDFVASDVRLLALIAQHVAPVVIPLPVLGEVDGLDESTALALGLTVAETTLDHMREAADRARTLSFVDYLCLLTARDLRLVCVTNDSALLTACRNQGVATMRGLRPLIHLVQAGVITPRGSLAVVRTIREGNAYITPTVVRAYVTEIRVIARSRWSSRLE